MVSAWIQRMKLTALALLTAGTLFGPGCGMTDIRDSMVSGGLGFVKTMTTEFLDMAVPNLDEMFPSIPAEQQS